MSTKDLNPLEYVSNVDQRLESVESKVSNVDQRLESVESKVSNVDQRLESVEKGQQYRPKA